KKR
ncbi:hypothetical protein VCHENC02_2532B, partial [Vibrio harveyi]